MSGGIDDESRLVFDHFDSAHLEFDCIANEVEKVLFPEEEMRYDDLGIVVSGRSGVQHALQSVQTLISMTNKVSDMEEQVKKSKEVEMMLQAEVDDLTSSKAEADALIVELQEQLSRHVIDVGHLRATITEVESLKLKLVGSGMAIAMAAVGAEIKTKASMVLDWENNKTDTWDIQKIYAEAKELVELEARDPEKTDDL